MVKPIRPIQMVNLLNERWHQRWHHMKMSKFVITAIIKSELPEIAYYQIVVVI